MDSASASIPVRSEQQAMDWSLVLASQGIEAAIEQEAETGQWRLLVSEADLARARQSIRLYLVENRDRRWRRELQFTGLLFDWRCLFWAAYLAIMFFFSETLPEDLRQAGCMDAAAVLNGEWWRLLTATTLHADVGHLAANLTTGVVLAGLAMGAYGAGTALFALFGAGALGNLAVQLLHGPPHLSLGASGMVMGAMGLLSVHSVKQWRQEKAARFLGRSLMAGILLLVLFGLNPGTDVLAHVGGFAGGCLIGTVLSLVPENWFNRRYWDGALAWLTGIWLAICWALALKFSAGMS
jgi:rhomboid protease GluP